MAKYKNQRFIEQEEQDDIEIEAAEEEIKIQAEKPVSDEEATFKKRYSDLRRHLQEKDAEYKNQISSLESKIHQLQQGVKLPKTEEELQEWSKRYPDVSAIIETLVQKRVKEGVQEVQGKLQEFDNMKKQLTFKEAYAQLLKAHPDFDNIKVSQDFRDWLSTLDDDSWIIDALKSETNWKRASEAIQYYKDTVMNKKEQKPSKDLAKEAARSVSKPSASSEISSKDFDFSESQIQRMSAVEYEKNEEKISEAMRNGRILMDLTSKR